MNKNTLMFNKARLFVLKMSKIVGYSLGILAIVLLVYANSSKLTLGEKAYLARPTQLAVLTLPEQFSLADSARTMQYLQQQQSVYNASITMYSKTLAITVDAKKISRSAIIEQMQRFNPEMRERVMTCKRPECPVAGSLYKLHQIKYALCIR